MLSLHRWAFFFPFCLVSCTVFVLSLFYPRTYSATTTLERRNDPVMMNLPMSSGAASFKYFRSTIVRDLTSLETMREVVENLGLIDDLPRKADGTLPESVANERDALARSLGSRLRITTTSPSEHVDLIRIAYTGPDPNIGARLVDEAKRTYIRRTMAWIHEFLTSQRDYFHQEATQAMTDLKKIQREETRLRLDNPHIDPGNPGNLSLRLTQLELAHRELSLRKREYESELAALQQLLIASTPPMPPEPNAESPNRGAALDEGALPGPEALELSARISKIEGKVEELRHARGMTDNHPEVQDLLMRRRQLEAELDVQYAADRRAAKANVPVEDEPAYEELTRGAPWAPYPPEHSGLIVKIAALQAKLKDLEISIDTNELETKELTQAKREVFGKQELFADVLGRVAQARQQHTQLERTLANIEPAIKAIEQGRLLQFSEGPPARSSNRPISPKATTVVLLALLAGLATGIAFVVLAEMLDHVFRTSGQVARSLGLPMLESIDEIVTAEDRRRIFVRNLVITPVIVLLLLGMTSLTGSMAYLSIERPWAYERIKKVPVAARQFLTGTTEDTEIH
jgi:uncharacterized protein involved in exopolysaccharide biosynthesis